MDSHTTIRQKDQILSELYKSEHMKNAGPYARLKFAMDYWCALWFWPIDKADLLPSRSEFLFDMSLILEGTVSSVNVDKDVKAGQFSLFMTEEERMAVQLAGAYGDTIVDIPRLRNDYPRLDLVCQIAEKNHFMHWELEFADLFAERGGFDLVIGNPPWILLGWNEQATIGDSQPQFMIKKLSAAQTAVLRLEALNTIQTRITYYSEYITLTGQQNFLGAYQNYHILKGMKTNLFKCFLPQAWTYGNKNGVSAFIHPDGVYDDPKGGALRAELYPRLRSHYQFTNEFKLFEGVDHHTGFSLNIYCNKTSHSFDSIGNLFTVSTINDCYDNSVKGGLPGIKDENGNWNTRGHRDRVIKVGQSELLLFAKLFDGSNNWRQARLPVLHVIQFVEVLQLLAKQADCLSNYENVVCSSQLWNETTAQKDGTMVRNVHFPSNLSDIIYQGPHFNIANPVSKTSRRVCQVNSDYDSLDLTVIDESYIQRVNYSPACTLEEYYNRVPKTPDGQRLTSRYRLMLIKAYLVNELMPKKYIITAVDCRSD